jgi:general secretion pathway protein A
MYLGYYGLSKEPFSITPDPEFLYLTPSHKEAFAAVTYGVAKRRGFIVITGEVGAGKTTILRAYLDQVKREEVECVYLFDPNLSFRDLLQMLLRELGHDAAERDSKWMLDWLQWSLAQRFRAKRNVALIIDEAQNMPVETLEQLRMLSNLETAKGRLLQIVLVGRPELDKTLDLHSLRQLKQRIAVRAVIQPLTREQSRGYLRHRIEKAGGSLDETFTPAAVKALIKYGKGIPRTLNIIARNALIAGAGAQRRPVPARIVHGVVADLEGRRYRPWLKWALGAGVLLACSTAVVLALVRPGIQHSERSREARLTAPAVPVSPPSPKAQATPAKKSENAVAPTASTEQAASEKPAPVEEQAAPSVPHVAAGPSPKISDQVTPSQETPLRENKASEEAAEQKPAKTPPAQPAPEPDADILTTRVVKRGDCLTKLIREVYGAATDELVQAVLRRNPRIKNPDVVVLGETLIFPVIDKAHLPRPENP